MRILIISYLFPPAESPRAYRWGTLSNYFADQGIDVDVLCAGASTAELHPHPRVAVYTVPASAIQLARERAIRTTPQGRKRHEGWLRRRLRRVVGAFRWPDYSRSWVGPAYQKAYELAKSRHYDAVISVSLPFSAHLIAQRLRRDGILPGAWLVDVGDPFSLASNSTQVYGARFLARSQKSEREILHDCDRWFVTDSGARDALVSALGVDRRRALVAPPILTIPVFAAEAKKAAASRTRDRGRPLRFAYAGIFYEHVRPVERLGGFVELLLDELGEGTFEIDLFGDNERWRSRLTACSPASGSHVRLNGSLPRASLIPLLSQYDALLNFGNSTPFQVPSKVIEYAALAVPIVNVKGRAEDTSEQLLEGYPLATSLLIPDVRRDNNGWRLEAGARLHAFLSQKACTAQQRDERADWLARFSIPRVGHLYLDAISGT